jgi:hypothetical protein
MRKIAPSEVRTPALDKVEMGKDCVMAWKLADALHCRESNSLVGPKSRVRRKPAKAGLHIDLPGARQKTELQDMDELNHIVAKGMISQDASRLNAGWGGWRA